MRFAHPSFLAAAAAACLVLIALMVLLGRARGKALRQLGAPHLLAGLIASLSPARRRAKQTMIVAGVTLLFVSLARPQFGYRFEEVHRRGVDLLFAVDTSKSMLSRDVKPNRLERAKLAVRDLVERFPDDRVGLIAFAGTAFLQTPLTLDHGIFEQSLDALDTTVIPLGGTDVASAIDTASKALSDEQHEKVLVLLTDGEDLQGDALVAAEKAAKDGLVIDTVGVGTPSGELVPLPSNEGPAQFVRDEEGHFVTSRLDETLLRRIAQATQGSYRALGDGGGLEALYQESLSALPQSDLATRTQRVPIERYQWPLGAALLLLGIEPLVGERRRTGARSRYGRFDRSPRGRLLAAAGAGLGAIVLASGTASASPQSAERAYRAGKYEQAEADYAKARKGSPEDARLSFDLGDAAYRKGDFDEAAKAFEATLHSDDLKLQTQAYYNLGNARYRMGEHALAGKDIEATRREWTQAVDRYQGALALDAKDQEARDNLELVKRRLAELDRQQQQQQQDKKPAPDKSSQDSKQDKGRQKDKKDGKGQQDQSDKGQQGQSGKNPQDQADKGQQGQSGKNPQDQADKGQQGQSGRNPQDQADKGKASQGGTGGTGPESQPSTSRGDPKSTASNGDSKGAAASGEPAEPPSAPGQLSKQEAKALLDSLRGDLAITTRAPLAPPRPNSDAAPRKDW